MNDNHVVKSIYQTVKGFTKAYHHSGHPVSDRPSLVVGWLYNSQH